MVLLASVIMLLVSVVFFALLGTLFFHDIVTALINGLILYVLLYRAYFDLMKMRYRPYIIGLVAGFILELMLPPLPPLWPITFVVMVVFLVVETMRYLEARKGSKGSRKR
jgi:hypothetical protein